MLKFIVEESCENRDVLLQIINIIEQSVRGVVKANQLDSLKYLVVSESDMKYFRESVDKYAKMLNMFTCLTDDNEYSAGEKLLME